jgi:lysophospholipase L1-like esterase
LFPQLFDGLEGFYNRLPSRAKEKVGSGIWGYARHSAGLSVRFYTDATEVRVRYRLTLARVSAFPDVSNVSTSGVDLYVQTTNAATVKPDWRWAGRSTQKAQDVTDVLAKGMTPGRRVCQIYLPLYNGVEKFEIGVAAGAQFESVAPRSEKPIVFYGTSITQGGVASRVGLAFPAILGRRLDMPIINLGFCGYGKMEGELADLLAELDLAIYVLDALHNMEPAAVTERAEPFIRALRKAHPETPILLVGFGDLPAVEIFPGETAKRAKLNTALCVTYDKLVAEGFKHLYLLPGSALLGTDGEATGDGLHPNAIGMMRYADAYEPVLRTILTNLPPANCKK